MPAMNFEQARFNMVEQQIRPWDVLDQQVLDIILRTPREAFVPPAYRSLAFADTHIPLGHDQVMMRPNVEGRLLQALAIQTEDVVLEIGAGSGYLTACLAQLAEHVYSVDIFEDFVSGARRNLAALEVKNVTLSQGDAANGWDRLHKYDVIAITGAVPDVSDAYKHALAKDGRLFAIIGDESLPIMEARLITRVGDKQWIQESLFETSIPPLLNAAHPKTFVF